MLQKTSVALLLIFAISIGAFAQNFVHNFDAAKEMAAEQEKPILMIFSGSDWCKPCIQLRETVIGTDQFTTFAEEELVLLELDFPYKRQNRLPKAQRKHNDALAAKYNPTGEFPLMLLLDNEGNTINQFRFNKKMTAESLAAAIGKTEGTSKSVATGKR